MKRPPTPRRRRKPATARWWRGRRLTAYGKQALSVLVLIGTILLREHQTPAILAKREEEQPPDVWAVDLRGPESWWGISGPSRRIPEKPFPEQKTPPCTPPDEEGIAGGCWLALRSVAPCATAAFEHSGRCYYPVKRAQRPPTSVGD